MRPRGVGSELQAWKFTGNEDITFIDVIGKN